MLVVFGGCMNSLDDIYLSGTASHQLEVTPGQRLFPSPSVFYSYIVYQTCSVETFLLNVTVNMEVDVMK
jgi:hypothetical protein